MTLHEFSDPRLDLLVHRVSGPMSFRFHIAADRSGHFRDPLRIA